MKQNSVRRLAVARSARPTPSRHCVPGLNAIFTLVVASAATLAGCSTRPAWNDDAEAGTVAYWLARPAAVRVTGEDYAALWNAADEARRRFGFAAARSDYRGGNLMTQTVVSAQPFEFWRTELRTPSALAESAISTVRRRVDFTLGRLPGDEGFYVEPRVTVERQNSGERRVTNAADYGRVLGAGGQRTFREDESEAQRGGGWYANGRDEALERAIARRIANRTGGRLRLDPPPVQSATGP